MKKLQLSLKKYWFEMTKPSEKLEDYRDITPYWCNRLLLWNNKVLSKSEWYEKLCSGEHSTMYLIEKYIKNGTITFKHFDINVMTMGYPKSSDTERILNIEHKGIEIRTGNINWGAKVGVIYFVIKHGNISKRVDG